MYDSVAHTPLAGALVQVVRVESSPARPAAAVTTALSDSVGRFRLALSPGRFAVGFQHPALDVLGLESPIQGLEIAGDSSSTLTLFIPSAFTQRMGACAGRGDEDHRGMIAGVLSGDDVGRSPPNAEIHAKWGELGFQRGQLMTVSREVVGSVDSDGVYRVCGLPTYGLVNINITSPRVHPVDADLLIPQGSVIRHDFRLVTRTRTSGSAFLVLRVTDSSGTSLSTGSAIISELSRESHVVNGDVSIGGIPAGTWIVKLIALGYDPLTVPVEASSDSTATPPVSVTMSRHPQALDTVKVVARMSSTDQKVLAELDERMRVAAGTLIRDDNPSLLSAQQPSDAIRVARGFRYKGPTMVETMRPPICKATDPSGDMRKRAPKEIAIYLDGERMYGGLEAVNNMVPVKEVLAIEAYSEVASAPFLWRTNDACAVIAFWRKH